MVTPVMSPPEVGSALMSCEPPASDAENDDKRYVVPTGGAMDTFKVTIRLMAFAAQLLMAIRTR